MVNIQGEGSEFDADKLAQFKYPFAEDLLNRAFSLYLLNQIELFVSDDIHDFSDLNDPIQDFLQEHGNYFVTHLMVAGLYNNPGIFNFLFPIVIN
jgi:hypothetical protein